jgi:gluconokinase
MQHVIDQSTSAGVVLTIDIGTSSVRVLAYDRSARKVNAIEGRRTVEVDTDAQGAAEVDALQLCVHVAACIDEVLAQLDVATQPVVAVGIAVMATTMVGVNAQGIPIGPMRTYADTQSDGHARSLREQVPEAIVHQRTGCMIRPNYWPARFAWLQTEKHAEWSAATQWLSIGAFIAQEFTGFAQMTYSEASWTGLLDRLTLAWDAPWLAHLGVSARVLAHLQDADHALPPLTHRWATRWPQLAHVPWYGAIGDGAAANVGSGCIDEQFLALTVGTTGALRIALPGTPQPPPGLWCYRIDGNTALVGGATSEGGNVYQWVRNTLRLDGDEALIQARLAAYEPDAHGLTILPLYAGERSPGWAGDAKATIHGLHLGTSQWDIARASLEAIALRFGQIAAALPQTGMVIASGGALEHSPVWMQICADVLGRPVYASGVEEATARGAALLVLRHLRLIPSLAALPTTPSRVYTPHSAATERYAIAAHRQKCLYERMIVAPFL